MTEQSAEALARRFHEAYERLAPKFGYVTRQESAVAWEDVPEKNKRLMVAVAAEVDAAVLNLIEAAQAACRGTAGDGTIRKLSEAVAVFVSGPTRHCPACGTDFAGKSTAACPSCGRRVSVDVRFG